MGLVGVFMGLGPAMETLRIPRFRSCILTVALEMASRAERVLASMN